MQKIIDLKDWENRFLSHGFDNLVKLICEKHNIACNKIENVYCLENVIFKVADKIIKIYNPLVLSKQKQIAEVSGYKLANKLNLPVPKILCTGEIAGEDVCYYMIMDYINGKSLKGRKVGYDKLTELSYVIKDFLKKYNILPTKTDLKIMRTDCDKFKWELISEGLAADFKKLYTAIDFGNPCYVHADLHRGNIVLDQSDQFKIIDFGDNKIAPWQCELPPVICNLFKFDNKLIYNVFEKDMDYLKENLIKGFVINDFGTDYLEDMCNFLNYGNIKNIKDIQELKTLVDKAFEKGKN